MSDRFHKIVEEEVLNGSAYLQKSIKTVEGSQKRVFCQPCDIELFFDRILGHLKTNTHQNTAQGRNAKNELAKAIDYLEQLRARKNNREKGEKALTKNSNKSNEQQISNNIEPKAVSEKYEYSNEEEYYRFQTTCFIVKNNLPFALSERLHKFMKTITDYHEKSVL